MPVTAELHPSSHAHAVSMAKDLIDQGKFVLICGPAGSGRSWVLEQLASAAGERSFAGGGLAALASHPALALQRAVRVALPVDDIALCAEAVRSRTRGGLLLVDDVQHADAVTCAVLPLLAGTVSMAAAIREPHRLSGVAARAVYQSAQVIRLGALAPEEANLLMSSVNPMISEAESRRIRAASGGNAVAVRALAQKRLPDGSAVEGPVAAVAEAIADLSRSCRSALVALGLLGRPAHRQLLGEGGAALVEHGWARVSGDFIEPVSLWMAETAAGLASDSEREAMHRRLGQATLGVESARHLAQAGEAERAYTVAVSVAQEASLPTSDRCEALALAQRLRPSEDLALRSGRAALAAGRPGVALRCVESFSGDHVWLIRSWSHVMAGRFDEAFECVSHVEMSVPEAAQLRLLVRAECREEVVAVHGSSTDHPGLACALAVASIGEESGWEKQVLAAASAAEEAGDDVSARWSVWALTVALVDAARLEEAGATAAKAAESARVRGAYSWHTRFLAISAWTRALRSEALDEVISTSGDLADKSLPLLARVLSSAAVSLAEADAGALRSARARMDSLAEVPSSVAASVAWVASEAAWLDGQPVSIHGEGAGSLPGGLSYITAHWAAVDAGIFPPSSPPQQWPDAVKQTLLAWQREDPDAFAHAAVAWEGLAVREQARALLAEAMYESDSARAVACLQTAEALADDHGLAVLLGRIRRQLRQHNVRRDSRSARSAGDITRREQEVLSLVASGEPTRRIGQTLGITPETVETHIRSGMRKLGARTRTEAAVMLARKEE